MKKIICSVFVIYLLTALTACGNTEKEPQLWLAPTKSQDICRLGETILFDLQGRLFYADTNNDTWMLHPVEGDTGDVGWDVSLHKAFDAHTVYVVRKQYNMLLTVEQLSEDYERVPVSMMDGELMDESVPIVSEGICYYIKGTPEGKGGLGRTLKMFDLADSEKRTVLHIWENMDRYDYLSGLRKYDQYLVMTYMHYGIGSLWVYDTQKQEMVIAGDEDMSGAAYLDEKLYYIEDATGTVCSYDLKQQEKLGSVFPIPNYVEGVTLACDKDYLYINRSPQSMYDWAYRSSEILVYSHEGEFIDTIDLSLNADAVSWEIHADPFYCVYLGSTEDAVFVGRTNHMVLSVVFYIEKSQIGSETMEIHTLYLHRYEPEELP